MMSYIGHELENQIGSMPNCKIEINTDDVQIVPVDGRNIYIKANFIYKKIQCSGPIDFSID